MFIYILGVSNSRMFKYPGTRVLIHSYSNLQLGNLYLKNFVYSLIVVLLYLISRMLLILKFHIKV